MRTMVFFSGTVAFCAFVLYGVSPVSYSNNESSTTAQPADHPTGYIENTLTTALQGGITSTGTMLIDRYEFTLGLWKWAEEIRNG